MVALVVLAAPALLVAASLVQLSVRRQSLQRSVDSAAQRGAKALAYGQDPRQAVLFVLRKRGLQATTQNASVVWPIPDGHFAGQPQSVRVRVAVGWKPPFAPFLSELRLEIRAASAVVPRELVASTTPVVVRIE